MKAPRKNKRLLFCAVSKETTFKLSCLIAAYSMLKIFSLVISEANAISTTVANTTTIMQNSSLVAQQVSNNFPQSKTTQGQQQASKLDRNLSSAHMTNSSIAPQIVTMTNASFMNQQPLQMTTSSNGKQNSRANNSSLAQQTQMQPHSTPATHSPAFNSRARLHSSGGHLQTTSSNFEQEQRRGASSAAKSGTQQQLSPKMLSLDSSIRDGAKEGSVDQHAGYSYDSSAGYTHISQLSPAKVELRAAETLQARAKVQQPTQVNNNYGQVSARNSVIQQTSTESTAFAQLPVQIGGSQFPNPCRPPLSLNPMSVSGAGSNSLTQQRIEEQSLISKRHAQPKYQRVADGKRLRTALVFKVLHAKSLTDCETQCALAGVGAGPSSVDACRSFNYRPMFAAENCELSRIDIRALRLEDASQFEQNNSFDFYALMPQQATSVNGSQLDSMLAVASANAPMMYSPFAPSAPSIADCIDVTQHCSLEGIEFTLRTGEPFNGRIYTLGFYDSCFTLGSGSTTNSLRITRSNGFPRCGTQQIGDLMTNIVVVQFNDFVQTTRDKKYNLTCTFAGPAETVVTSNYLDTTVHERSLPMQVEHLPLQNVVTSNVHLRVLYRGQPTNTIAVGDLLTFRLESRSIVGGFHRADSEFAPQTNEIFATNVIAKDPSTGRQVQLIDASGCPVDPMNVFPELQRTPDGALEAEFYAFKIPDSNFLIFQATVRTCKSPCEPVICGNTNSQTIQTQLANTSGGTKSIAGLVSSALMSSQMNPVPSWGRRRRRRSTNLDEANEALSSDAGEVVEHTVPARLITQRQIGATTTAFPSDQPNAVGNITTGFRSTTRPALNSEAEEEVRQMLRVFASRDEMRRDDNARVTFDELNHSESPASATFKLPALPAHWSHVAVNNLPSHFETLTENIPQLSRQQQQVLPENEVCLSEIAYYTMLFSIVSVSLLMFSAVLIALLVKQKTSKFSLSAVSSSMNGSSEDLAYPVSFSSHQRLTTDESRASNKTPPRILPKPFGSVFVPSSFSSISQR